MTLLGIPEVPGQTLSIGYVTLCSEVNFYCKEFTTLEQHNAQTCFLNIYMLIQQ